MDFRLTDQQLELQAAMRTFCERQYAFERIGAFDSKPLDAGAWAQLVELDVFRLAVPEPTGGLGLGVLETAVVFEVLGSYLVPGPLVWTALAGLYVPELAERPGVVGGVEQPGDSTDPVLIEHGSDIDALLVLRDDGAFVVDRDDLGAIESVPPTDPLTSIGRVHVLPPGRQVADRRTADEMRNVGAVLTSALLLGNADRSLQAAVAYTTQRQQFGRAIASFQAIKHLLADVYVRTCLARSATYAAAAMVDDRGAGDPDNAASAAKLVAADAAIRNAKTCIQVHGGMGFTWEMIPHYLLKRAWVLEHSFGGRSDHASAIATALALEVAH